MELLVGLNLPARLQASSTPAPSNNSSNSSQVHLHTTPVGRRTAELRLDPGSANHTLQAATLRRSLRAPCRLLLLARLR